MKDIEKKLKKHYQNNLQHESRLLSIKEKVSFNKTDYSLSELAKKIMTEHFGTNWKHYRGPDFFKYNGEILSERKNRMLGDTE